MGDIKAILENGYDNVVSVLTDAAGNITTQEIALATVGTALGVAGVTGVVVATRKKSTKKKKAKKRTSTKRKTSNRRRRTTKRKLKFGSAAYRKKYLGKRRRKQRQPHTAGKRKDTSHKRIRYTKNNQPYLILASGKARFIKKSSVRVSRKRKGGKY